ncbi:MAG: HipA family kinase [Solirubrobacteraceae bacterium]
MSSELRRVAATRYVAPLREGGSMPGLVEADDDGLYVVKFRGAGQGPGALVAEVVAGELARALGLAVPELAIVDVVPELGHAEPDPEIQELIEASPGVNAGMDFLPGAMPFTLLAEPPLTPEIAADVVWFDALVTNVDRTPTNPNLIVWHGRTWLIDHGAAFFRQHGARPLSETAHAPVPGPGEHVLLPVAGPLAEADARLAERADAAVEDVVALVPDVWLGVDPAARRADFAAFLHSRLRAPRAFVEEVEHARG